MSTSNRDSAEINDLLEEVRKYFFQEGEVLLYWNFGAVKVFPLAQAYSSKEQNFSWLVVTNSRLILCQQKYLGKGGVKFISLSSIQSAELIEQWLDRTHLNIQTINEVLEVSALNFQDVWHTDKKELLTKLLQVINNAQQDYKKSSINSEHPIDTKYSYLELLTKLEELHRAGILNEAEYEEKKKGILKLI